MPSGIDEGLNISQKEGTGDAGVLHWEGVQRTLNQIAQQDMYHQKNLMDEYRKSQIAMQTAGAKLRPVDLPTASQYYDQFRNSSLALLDRKVRNDPQALAHFSQLRDQSFQSYLSHAEKSKDAMKFDTMLDEQRLRDKGINWIAPEEYGMKKQLRNQTPVEHLDGLGLNNVASFTTPADDTPKNHDKIPGAQKTFSDETPHYDAKGKLDGWFVSQYSSYPKPAAAMAHEYLDDYKMSHTLQQKGNATFLELNKTNPAEIDKTINDALSIAKTEQGGEHAYLPRTPEGLYAAQKIVEHKAKIYDGTKTFKTNDLYKQDKQFAQQEKMLNMRENAQDARTKAIIQAGLNKAAMKAKWGKSDPEIPSLDFFESGLSHPDTDVNGKTALELVTNQLSLLGSATTGTAGGTEAQPLPMFSSKNVDNNQWYQSAISQTRGVLSLAAKQAGVTENYHNSANKLASTADLYNKINEKNNVSARFTANDIRKATPIIFTETRNPSNSEPNGSKRFGILMPGTPEFRNFIENQRQKTIKGLKKFSMGMSLGDDGSVDDGSGDGENVSSVAPPPAQSAPQPKKSSSTPKPWLKH